MKTINELEEKLNNISVKPLSEEEKGVMWSKIEKGINQPVKSPFWSAIASPFSALRLQTSVAVALMVAVLFGTTSITFAYADNSKPGDFLFPISALKEKIVISLTPTQNQNEVRLRYAEKRIEQGNEFLTALNANVTTSASTQALGDKIASSSVSTPTYYKKATSSPAVVGDAVSHLSATIAYLQGVKADMIAGGNTSGAQTIQTAIDRILEQVTLAANQNAVVIAKVQEHKNQFNVTISVKNASTTDTVKLAINTKKDTQKITITEKENRPAIKIEEVRKKEEIKKEEKKQENKDNENRKKNNDNDEDDDENNDEKENKGFFGWFGNDKKSNICHKGETINISNSAVMAHLKHGDSAGVCNGTIPPPIPNTDTTAPVVSGVSTSVTSTTAKIIWDTNENATAVFWYGTSATFTSSVNLSGLQLNQEVNLISLLSDTTYSFAIVAKDSFGNIATTTTQTFKTTIPLDINAPTFSDIAVAHASETATVSWKTNENATGKIYYGTVTPLTPSTAPNTKLDTGYSLNHSFDLTGLATSTTYYFVLEGKDNAGNIATSTEHQFTTGS